MQTFVAPKAKQEDAHNSPLTKTKIPAFTQETESMFQSVQSYNYAPSIKD